MHWIYLIHEFHNLSWITEINELFHDILIYWDAPVFFKGTVYIYFTRVYSKTDNWNCFCVLKWPRVQNKRSALYLKQSTSFCVPPSMTRIFPLLLHWLNSGCQTYCMLQKNHITHSSVSDTAGLQRVQCCITFICFRFTGKYIHESESFHFRF